MKRQTNMYYTIVQDPHEEKHFHPDMEVIYVVLGSIKVRIIDTEYILNKRDVIVINSGVEHIVIGKDESIICIAYYPRSVLSLLCDKAEGMFFICNSTVNLEYSYKKIRNIFQEIVLEYMKQNEQNVCMEWSLLYKLLACLIDEFAISEESQDGHVLSDSVRLQKMIQYIIQNFSRNISLSELAEKMYTSSSTLSRFFKKQTGIYFADYVNQIRMRYAVQGLLYTEESITKIAVDSGFSNLSVFNRLFKKMYGSTPNEYRKKLKQSIIQNETKKEEIRDKLREEFNERDEEKAVYTIAEVMDGKKYKKVWGYAINVGSISTLLLANTQYHVIYLTENLGFRYVRLWNIFSTQMMMTDGIHSENFNYDQTDIVFDFLVNHNIRPFLDFGIRPRTAVYNINNYIYYGDEYVEFQTREVWEKAVTSFIRHMIERYGKENVSRWIFELSYDVHHKTSCYIAENYSFFDAYSFLYHTVKGMLPDAEVGGPMVITRSANEFVKDFLRMSKNRQCVPDFVSILLFPYISEAETGGLIYGKTEDDFFENNEVDRIRGIMKKEGVECRLYISEWNYTISSRSYLNDSCFRASYYTDRIVRLLGKADLIIIWMASDWVSNYYDVKGVANGGNGLLTKDTICKPAYYAIQFLNTLGGELLKKGDNYLITKKEENNYYILLFHYRALGGDYLIYEKMLENPGRIRMIYEGQSPMEIRLSLKPMKAARYVIKRRIISPTEGSLLWEWGKFDFDSSLTSQEVKYIRQICFPRISLKKQEPKNGNLEIQEKLGPHEIILIHIYEEKIS